MRTITITKGMAAALCEAWDFISGPYEAEGDAIPAALMGIGNAVEALYCKGRVPAELPAEFVGATLNALAEGESRCARAARRDEALGFHGAADYWRDAAEACRAAFRTIMYD